MKKFLGILAVAGVLVACDNSAADAEKKTKDSLDSVAKAQKEMVQDNADSTKNKIEANKDSMKNMVDSLHKGDSTKPKM